MLPPTVTRAQALQTARDLKSELHSQMVPVSTRAASRAATRDTNALAGLAPNILGIGYGAKQAGGASIYDELAVRVYVRAKLPRKDLSQGELVPENVNGTPTDVIPVGDISALQAITECGVSCGHHKITAGTLGCLVRKQNGNGGGLFILSNNHVLANSNAAKAGDRILHPGPMDGGTDPIARLTDFEPLDFKGTNRIDGAIAELLDEESVDPGIRIIGPVIPPPGSPAVYQSVRKHGRTTQHTVGVIMDIAADIRVRYGTRIAAFEDQLAIEGLGGNFSQGGDSGSLIVDAVKRSPVGLLFAGGGTTTFANWIEPVLTRFDVSIV